LVFELIFFIVNFTHSLTPMI